ncbi:hypothetical protein LEP1GSC073_3521 [Leptospira noguchii str. Cascata]|nr:hypothetical protein LEP1GSC073_3521 [Leptospira noguchii str. Cascata]
MLFLLDFYKLIISLELLKNSIAARLIKPLQSTVFVKQKQIEN